jgi:RHS repeat-associated protein
MAKMKFEYRNMAEADNELTWSNQQSNTQGLITSSVYAGSGYEMPSPFGSGTDANMSYSIYAAYTPDDQQEYVTLLGNPFMYTGQAYEEQTGLYYYHARFYSPRIGRFLQTDPVGYDGGMNWYAYCRNNPVNYFDPTGLLSIAFYDGSMFEEAANDFNYCFNMADACDYGMSCTEYVLYIMQNFPLFYGGENGSLDGNTIDNVYFLCHGSTGYNTNGIMNVAILFGPEELWSDACDTFSFFYDFGQVLNNYGNNAIINLRSCWAGIADPCNNRPLLQAVLYCSGHEVTGCEGRVFYPDRESWGADYWYESNVWRAVDVPNDWGPSYLLYFDPFWDNLLPDNWVYTPY